MICKYGAGDRQSSQKGSHFNMYHREGKQWGRCMLYNTSCCIGFSIGSCRENHKICSPSDTSGSLSLRSKYDLSSPNIHFSSYISYQYDFRRSHSPHRTPSTDQFHPNTSCSLAHTSGIPYSLSASSQGSRTLDSSGSRHSVPLRVAVPFLQDRDN